MQKLLPVMCSIAAACLSSRKTMHQHIAVMTVELLCCETPQFISPDKWPANSHDLNPVNHCIWDMMQTHVYQVPIRDADKLWQWIDETWAEFQHSVVDNAIN